MNKRNRYPNAGKLKCTAPGCSNKILRGIKYCQAHTARLRKTGSLQLDKPIGYKNHGYARTSTYRSWRMMLNRCSNPNAMDFKYYAGRGIGVCKRWTKFLNFLKDMGVKPTPEHTLDRINNDKGYYKNNCRWATRLEQGRNTRSNRINLEIAKAMRVRYSQGVSYLEICDEFNLDYQYVVKVIKGDSWR